MPPSDALHDIRTEMMLTMIECGLKIEAQHHEVATGGQGEIDMRFAPLVEMADNVLKYKYIVKNVARKHGKTATFMPKPLFMDNGTRHARPLLAVEGRQEPVRRLRLRRPVATWPCTPSAACCEHAPALCAITNPTTNSYKRLVPGYEAPVNLAYSRRNRSAVDPHPGLLAQPQGQAARVPLPRRLAAIPTWPSRPCSWRCSTASRTRSSPGEPLDKDIYDLEPEELAKVPKTPGSLDEALNNLEKDHEFLLQGDVFTSDVISTWIWYKREKEVDAIRLRPHPYEFALYYDI